MTLIYTPELPVTSVADTTYEEFLDILNGLVLVPSDIVINIDRRSLTIDGEHIALTHQEFALLAHLATQAERVVPREELLSTVWAGTGLDINSRTVDAHIRRLRVKLGTSDLITTVRGQGYRFQATPDTRIIATRDQRRAVNLAA